jgi:hypothetical protein
VSQATRRNEAHTSYLAVARRRVSPYLSRIGTANRSRRPWDRRERRERGFRSSVAATSLSDIV